MQWLRYSFHFWNILMTFKVTSQYMLCVFILNSVIFPILSNTIIITNSEKQIFWKFLCFFNHFYFSIFQLRVIAPVLVFWNLKISLLSLLKHIFSIMLYTRIGFLSVIIIQTQISNFLNSLNFLNLFFIHYDIIKLGDFNRA